MKQGKEPWTKSEDARVLVSALKLTSWCQPKAVTFLDTDFLICKTGPEGKTDRDWCDLYLSSAEPWDSGELLQGPHGGKEGAEWAASIHHPHPA